MTRLLLIIALAIAAWILYHFAKQNYKKHGRSYLIKLALIALAGLILLAVVTGRAHALYALVAAAIPFIGRLMPLLRFLPLARQLYGRYRGAQSGSGNQSNVRTAWLAMTLDHDSGTIDGEVLDGTFQGRLLSALSLDELQQFYRDCQTNDPEALRLLDAYLQRERAGEWENQPGGGSSYQNRAQTDAGSMNESDAWEVLGLAPGASREEIVDTHRRLMSKLHPDKGGSNFLASQINRAKETLLDTVK
ncbi:MAG: DnaJ domain-containing protein [Pseudomonadota bacterium]